MARQKTSKSTISLAERRQEVMRLRLQGKNIEEIRELVAQKAGKKFSVGTIHNDITAELEKTRSLTQQDAQQLRTLELQRLDMLMGFAGPKAAKQDLNAINTLLRILESRRKLLGLDAPVQVQVNQAVQTELDQLIEFLEQHISSTAFAEVLAAVTAATEASAAAATN